MGFHKNLRGTDLHAPSIELIENNSGADILPLTVVAINGMGAIYPQIIPSDPAVNLNFGIVKDYIPDGNPGYVYAMGFLEGVDTSFWPSGTALYGDALGQLSSVPSGPPVAVVIKQNAITGVLYVTAGGSLTSGENWSKTGNVNINPATNFLGTIDSQPIKIRTNNIPIAQFDTNGRFAIGAHNPQAPLHIKTYSGYSDSGYRVDVLSLTSASTSYTDAYTAYLTNGQVIKIKIQVVARQSDGTQRATFTRSGLFYKQGGNVAIEGQLQSDFTIKSNPALNITYALGTNYVSFRVKNAVAVDTYWTGHVEIEYLSTNT